MFADNECALKPICPDQVDFESLNAYHCKRFAKSVYFIIKNYAMTHPH